MITSEQFFELSVEKRDEKNIFELRRDEKNIFELRRETSKNIWKQNE